MAVRNLFLENAKVEGGETAGGLAGRNTGSLDNVHISGEVSAAGSAGGLAGENFGEIRNCSFSGEVAGRSAGGLCAANSGAATSDSGSRGRVFGQKIGGLFATAYRATAGATRVERCYSFCDITQVSYDDTAGRTGGFIASRETGVDIENCFAPDAYPAVAYGEFRGVRALTEAERAAKETFAAFDFDNDFDWEEGRGLMHRTIAVSSRPAVLGGETVVMRGDRRYYNLGETAELSVHAGEKENIGAAEAWVNGEKADFTGGKYRCPVTGQINVRFTAQYLLQVELNRATANGALTQEKRFYAPGDPIIVEAVPAKHCRFDSLTASYRGEDMIITALGENRYRLDFPRPPAAFDDDSVLLIDAKFIYRAPVGLTDILVYCLMIAATLAALQIIGTLSLIRRVCRASVLDAGELYKRFAKRNLFALIAVSVALAMAVWILLLAGVWLVPQGQIFLLAALPLVSAVGLFVLRFWRFK